MKKYYTKIHSRCYKIFNLLSLKLGTKVTPDVLKNNAFFDSFGGANYLK